MSKLAILGGTPVGGGTPVKWPVYDDLERKALLDVLESGSWGTGGPKQVEFEEKFAAFCGAKHGVMMCNGTHTLRLALEALGIGPGDEVIVPGLTWQATAACVLDVNAVPVLTDVSPVTMTIDPEQIRRNVTPRTKAIIPVHLYGRMADMDAILGIAKEHGLFVIEDCAHQHGSEWRGKKAGTMGVIGSFSLQMSKIFTTGEGGACLTEDDELYELLYALKFCGREHFPGAPTMQSGNYRGNEFAAAMGIAQLTRLQAQNELRDRNAKYLERQLGQIPGLRMFERDPRVTFQAYYHFPMHYEREGWNGVHRDRVMAAVKAELGTPWLRRPYDPLNNSPFYQPHSKKTHHISEEYWRRIDPKQYELPVATRFFEGEYLGFAQEQLLADRDALDRLVEAFAKVHDNLDELAKAE